MKPSDVILARLWQADGRSKTRPAVILCEMPPFKDVLVCGVSTQVHLLVPGFDELISSSDHDFRQSGLLSTSLIRLGYLAILTRQDIIGGIGSISPQRHRRLLQTLADFLVSSMA
jgi:mRNA interferase MazF